LWFLKDVVSAVLRTVRKNTPLATSLFCQSAQSEGYDSGNDGGSFHRVTAGGGLNLLS
jgi:hypothetical protein